ncbi:MULTISPECIES: hypothetical protein [Caldisericum]|jgi:hypothetical protein|uniref:hypothetical protein n=1 Tax=Caldisericum TaxID=693074 RepID=UPI0039FCA95E
MRKGMIILLIVSIIIGVYSFVVVSAHTSHSLRSSYKDNSSTSSSLLGEKDLSNLGIELKEARTTPKLDKDAAIKRAKQIIGTVNSEQASNINAIYVLFTQHAGGIDSPPITLPGSNLELRDIPVWIVTFQGVHMPTHGGGPGWSSASLYVPEMNVVVDANNGAELVMFAFKCASADH